MEKVLAKAAATSTVFPILFALSLVHLLNDSMQSTISALFPVLKSSMNLTYTQVGLIAFAMNMTASLLQPAVGIYADIRSRPYLLPVGVIFTLFGIVLLAVAPNFAIILCSVIGIGVGSAIFHPESSRVAFLASGGKRGMAQSIFQLGGNIGNSLGPVMTALIFVPLGQFGVIWFAIAAVSGIVIQYWVAGWYSKRQLQPRSGVKAGNADASRITKRRIASAIIILIFLVFSKHVYISSITSFYSFFLIEDYFVSVKQAQLFLFAFLAASAAGTFVGGPLADRYGRRTVIWLSILGTAPFSILLPHANLAWSGILCACGGFVLSSAFSIIIVYAQELLPGRIGLVSGLFFGLAFGLGGIGSAVLGSVADATSISFVMKLCSYLPLLGILAVFLPKDEQVRHFGNETP